MKNYKKTIILPLVKLLPSTLVGAATLLSFTQSYAEINPASGNYSHTYIDYQNAAEPFLSLKRTFNSSNTKNLSTAIGVLGKAGWSMPFLTEQLVVTRPYTTYTKVYGPYYHYPDGKQSTYYKTQNYSWPGHAVIYGAAGEQLALRSNVPNSWVSLTDKKATITCTSYSDITTKPIPGATDWGVSSSTEVANTCASFSVQWSNGKKQTFGKKVGSVYKLTAVTEPSGWSATLAYDTNGRLVSITSVGGRVISFTYNTDSSVSKITAPGSYSVNYSYTNGVLTGVTGPAGLGEQYQYQNTAKPLLLTQINDLAGALLEKITFDSNSKVTRVEGPNNFRVSTLTDNLDTTRTLVDPRQVVRTYTYEYQGGYKPTYISASDGNAETASYDAEGRVVYQTDFNGKVTNFVYNSTGTQITASDSNGLVTTSTLDANWKNLLSFTTPLNKTTFTYDSRGNLLTKTQTVSGVARTWVNTYDSVGRLTTATDPQTGKTSYSYDTSGALTKITNALNHSWTVTSNDPHGRPLSLTTPSGEIITYLYDAAGRLTRQTINNNATTFIYNKHGKLASVTRPDASVITFTYNIADFLTAITDSSGAKTAYTLDGAGRPVTATQTKGGVIIAKQNYTYDALTGEIASLTNGLGNKIAYRYDASGRMVNMTDPLNRQKDYYYSGLSTSLQADNGSVYLNYDVLGNLTNIMTPDGQQTNYSVDGFGQVNVRQSPDTGQDQYVYYSNGLIKTRTDAKNNVTSYAYDALGRLTTMTYSDGQKITYVYDTARVGALSSINGGGAILNYTYDPQGQVKSVAQVVGTVTRTLGYTWDASGKVSAIVTPSGQTIGFTYPAKGTQPSGVTLNGTPLINQLVWLPFSANPSSWVWANGVTHQRLVDLAGQTKKVETTGVLSRTLTRDAVGNSLIIADAQDAKRTQTFTYDFLDALLTEKTGAGRNDSFIYDANNNRQSWFTDASGVNGNSYGYTGNQLTSITNNTTWATNNLAYDATGHLIQDASRTFNYDARQRLTSVTKNGQTTSYRYNGLGQRFSKTGVLYMYDLQGHLVGEYTSAGVLIQETVWLNDLPIATLRPNGTGIAVYFVHPDELGTPRVVTDTTNKPVWRWDSDAFGRTLPNQDPLKTGKSFVYHLRYPGQYYDTQSGLHYNYFRDYDPQTGRYIQSDPIGLAGGFNTYAYVGGNPVNYIDPYGESATAVVGGWIGTDTAIPDPTDAAWPKWAGYGAALGSAALLDWLIYNNENSNDDGGQCPDGSPDDKKLSNGEIDKLKDAGLDPHDLKPKKGGSKFDLFKDKNGNIIVKPKKGNGLGDPTGLNINDF